MGETNNQATYWDQNSKTRIKMAFRVDHILFFAAIAFLAVMLTGAEAGPTRDCLACATDISKAVEDCADIPPDDEHALLKCIEDALESAADCIVCICDILATIYDMDLEPCHGTF